jgi:phage terminase large subunit-like protein
VRNLIDEEVYSDIFPAVKLATDSKSLVVGILILEGNILRVVLDRLSRVAGHTYSWLMTPIRSRMLLTATLLFLRKPTNGLRLGHVLVSCREAVLLSFKRVGTWMTSRVESLKTWCRTRVQISMRIIEFPAILDAERVDPDTGETVYVQKPLWPEFFDLAALMRTKASMPVFQWNAQYQQCPTAEEAAIVKRDWWQIWDQDSPPHCEYIIMSLDAAAEKHNRADYTALTTWGVFYNEEVDNHNIILLDSIKERLEFPELKQLALKEYSKWDPDAFIVEKKSAGAALYQEMRRMGLPVQEYTPHRGSGDKLARLNFRGGHHCLGTSLDTSNPLG